MDEQKPTPRPAAGRRERRSQSAHAPSFPLYWRDWLSSPEVRAMTAEERGGYIDVLCFTQGTKTPGVMTEDEVRAWAGYPPEQWPVHREAFRRCFKVTASSGTWIQARAKRERGAQLKRFRRAQKAAKEAAQKRWRDKRLDATGMAQADAKVYPSPCPSPCPSPEVASSKAMPAAESVPSRSAPGRGRSARGAVPGVDGAGRGGDPEAVGSLVGTLMARVAERSTR